MNPKITVLLCTVRPDNGYVEHPEWGTLSKVAEDLERQTFKDFEAIVVDGLFDIGARHDLPFPFKRADRTGQWHIGPRDTLWTRNKKVAICAYRNTGLIHARGELVVNLDDCCELPPNYLEAFWRAWSRYKVCLAMKWPHLGDSRPTGPVARPGMVYGFGSYPLEVALQLNGYDEAYDGGQGLEDADWSTRLFNAGVKMALLHIPGFTIHPQSAHDPRAIDEKDPIAKCCNAAWQLQRVRRQVQVANIPENWDRETVGKLVGPCPHLMTGDTCAHHNGLNVCAYIDKGWPREPSALQQEFLADPKNWPVVDLRAERKRHHAD